MSKAYYLLLPIIFFLACNSGAEENQQALLNEFSQMKTQIDLDVQGFEWQGEDLNKEVLENLNHILNHKSINPSLTSTCFPPGQGRESIRYQEHYRCGSVGVLSENCELWTETIPIKNGENHKSIISDLEAKLIFHRAINYGNESTPQCSCQKRPSIPIRYMVQATSAKDDSNQTLTKKIWVMTTYNCCGPC